CQAEEEEATVLRSLTILGAILLFLSGPSFAQCPPDHLGGNVSRLVRFEGADGKRSSQTMHRNTRSRSGTMAPSAHQRDGDREGIPARARTGEDMEDHGAAARAERANARLVAHPET